MVAQDMVSETGQQAVQSEDAILDKMEQDVLGEMTQVDASAGVGAEAPTPGEVASDTPATATEASAPESTDKEASPEQKQEPTETAEAQTTESEAKPEMISALDAEQSRKQALKTQRTNIEQDLDRRVKAAVTAERTKWEAASEESRLAKMSDGARGEYERKKLSRQAVMDEVRPEVTEQVLQTVQTQIAPALTGALGVDKDPEQWPDDLKEAWNEALKGDDPPSDFIKSIGFLHKFVVGKTVAEAEANGEQKLQKALADQKAEFEKTATEAAGAEGRSLESAVPMLGANGQAPINSNDAALEARIASGEATFQEIHSWGQQAFPHG